MFEIQYKEIPLQAWTGPEGSRRLRLPDFSRQSPHEGGKFNIPVLNFRTFDNKT
jgi:hypothetical protein